MVNAVLWLIATYVGWAILTNIADAIEDRERRKKKERDEGRN